METELLSIIPVLPSSDIARDINWYKEKLGFETHFSDNMYAVIYRKNLCIHLQWHAGTADDPLLGGSVIRLYVKNIQSLFDEFVNRGTISKDKFRADTAWKTNEFGFYDLNNNAIFIMEDIEARNNDRKTHF
ncbi:MAG: hypothetical protein WDN26_03435 [Chitinophagaceae bacterium]